MMPTRRSYSSAAVDDRPAVRLASALFPTGRSGMHPSKWGRRDDSTSTMQVVSARSAVSACTSSAAGGATRRRDARVSSTGSTRTRVGTGDAKPPRRTSGSWTIHPFDVATGESRAIADMSQLARSEGSSQRFYSMSAQIRRARRLLWHLERTQQAAMDITPWMEWFLGRLTRAIRGAQAALSGAIDKVRY